MNSALLNYKKNLRSARFWVILIITALIVVVTMRFCSHLQQKPKAPPSQRVAAAIAHLGDMPIYVDALGTVSSSANISIQTQVDGQLMQAFFQEGQDVKKGDLLLQIDPRPYQALLTQYEGQLIRDQALLDNAKIDLKRYQTLWEQDSISEQILATQLALVKQYEGDVKIDEGLIASTKLDLDYCQIKSPVDGRAGLLLVDPGNYVQTNGSVILVNINTLNPISVIFSLAEDYIPKIFELTAKDSTPVVLAYDRQQEKLLATGQLSSVDSQVNTSTGTINLKADFDNTPIVLFPNQFVNIRLLLATLKNAVIIPTAAIQYNSQGPYVFVVNEDNTVKITPVKIDATAGEDTSISSGIAEGQWVVTTGTNKLIDGIKVSVSKAKNKK